MLGTTFHLTLPISSQNRLNCESGSSPLILRVTLFLMCLILESIAQILLSDCTGNASPTLICASVRKRYIISLISKSSDVTVFPRRKITDV